MSKITFDVDAAKDAGNALAKHPGIAPVHLICEMLTVFANSARVEGPNYEAAKKKLALDVAGDCCGALSAVTNSDMERILDALASPKEEAPGIGGDRNTDGVTWDDAERQDAATEGMLKSQEQESPASKKLNALKGRTLNLHDSTGKIVQSVGGEELKPRRMKANPAAQRHGHAIEHDELTMTGPKEYICSVEGCQPVESTAQRVPNLWDACVPVWTPTCQPVEAAPPCYLGDWPKSIDISGKKYVAKDELDKLRVEIERLKTSNYKLSEALRVKIREIEIISRDKMAAITRAEIAEKEATDANRDFHFEADERVKLVAELGAECKRADAAKRRGHALLQSVKHHNNNFIAAGCSAAIATLILAVETFEADFEAGFPKLAEGEKK